MGELGFKINQRIEILDDNATYRSNIQDIRSDSILITLPFSETNYYPMHAGSILEFFVCTEREVLKCKSDVMSKVSENNVELAVLSTPKVIERVQRREYFRLPITMEAKYLPLPQQNTYLDIRSVSIGHFNNMETVLTIDLSGGGAKIITKINAKIGQKAILSIFIPEELRILCTVIRVDTNEDKRNYRMALKFEKIDERLRDKIIQFIFNKFREQSRLLR